MRIIKHKLFPLLLILLLIFGGCSNPEAGSAASSSSSKTSQAQVPVPELTSETGALKSLSASEKATILQNIPSYSGSPYYVVNNNLPFFSETDFTTTSFETYSELDDLGRCQEAYANIGSDLMPTESRGSIGSVKPTGWQSAKYDCVDGKYLYNRCHLIGFQLTGENANSKNLITGTRYLNVDGMLPFENMVADYIKETDNHVLYRVTPIFTEDHLVADGVLMEALSVEDEGEGILFNVYCYNVQPVVEIDYATGESRLSENPSGNAGGNISEEPTASYILNTKTHKFHEPSCSSARDMKSENMQEYTGSRQELIDDGYDPCGICKP